jgi:6-phosphogluconolactonase (cycloisomerase 2 family)
VAQHGNLLYVLNFAGNSSVVGFTIDDGSLQQIPGSIRYLTAANSGASSLAFSPDGSFLLVTEKLTNNIDAFPVQADGTLGTVVTTKDGGAGLFDVAFTPDGVVVALEAGAATSSSFMLESSGALTLLGAGVPTMGGASCWFAITPDGRYVYTSNAGSANISGFAISGAGLLTALPGTIVGTYPSGSTNLDMAISGDGKYLYTVNSGTGTIGILAIRADGTLKLLGTVPALKAGSGENGIAAL